MPHLQALISLREVMGKTFQEVTLKARSEKIAELMIVTLLPHLKLYSKPQGKSAVPASEWQGAFHDFLSRAVRHGLALKARMQVAPQEYVMTWHEVGAMYDRVEMENLFERSEGLGEVAIGICILPGWRKDGTLVHKATVTLA